MRWFERRGGLGIGQEARGRTREPRRRIIWIRIKGFIFFFLEMKFLRKPRKTGERWNRNCQCLDNEILNNIIFILLLFFIF
jgi:hypothetical protein